MYDIFDYSYSALIIAFEVIALIIVFRKLYEAKVVIRFAIPLIVTYFIIAAANPFISSFLSSDATLVIRALPDVLLSLALFSLFFASGYLLSRKNRINAFPILRYLRPFSNISPRRTLMVYWKPALLIIVLINIYSFFVAFLLHPQPPETLDKILPKFLRIKQTMPVQFLLLVIGAALYEEILFRLFLQNLVERVAHRVAFKVPAAIVISSAVWAIGHSGMLVPRGTKELQIFGVGLILGYAARKWGLEVCIAAHLALNVCALVYFGFG
jgi:membrane protease YdiL (CAAX protease family)